VVISVIAQKQIDLHKGREILTHLDEVPNPIVSARQFVILNFDTLRQSGKTLKALHHFLTSKGIDVGTFESFRADYNSVKRARKVNSVLTEAAAVQPAEPGRTIPAKIDKVQNADAEKAPKHPPRAEWKPIRLANGTEVLIDPETGAKHFKI
jgi:cytochrome c5